MIFLPLMFHMMWLSMLPKPFPWPVQAPEASDNSVRAYVDGKPVKSYVKD